MPEYTHDNRHLWTLTLVRLFFEFWSLRVSNDIAIILDLYGLHKVQQSCARIIMRTSFQCSMYSVASTYWLSACCQPQHTIYSVHCLRPVCACHGNPVKSGSLHSCFLCFGEMYGLIASLLVYLPKVFQSYIIYYLKTSLYSQCNSINGPQMPFWHRYIYTRRVNKPEHPFSDDNPCKSL